MTPSTKKPACVWFRLAFLAALVALLPGSSLRGAELTPPDLDLLSPSEWERIYGSVDKAIAWLATQQERAGSFRNPGPHDSAVTSLAIMAMLSRGHTPGSGPYGQTIDDGIDYVLSCQQPDGQISSAPSHTHSTYHHAIAGVMLGECYAMTSGERSAQIRGAIERALLWVGRLQWKGGGNRPLDRGGWRYTRPERSRVCRADLSVTSWMIMFYRSARNAEFDVPEESLREAMEFVRRCHDPDQGGFLYCPPPRYVANRTCNWAMTAAGVVTLALAGQGDDRLTLTSGDWLRKHPIEYYGHIERHADRYHYATYYCSLATFQLGGQFWADYYPRVSKQLLDAQRPNGSWPDETGEDQPLAGVYSTSMAVMALAAPFQVLPIYQR